MQERRSGMKARYKRLLNENFGRGLAVTTVVLFLLLTTTLSAWADTVNISDQAGVLDAGQVRNEASSLPYRVDIYTVSHYNGSSSNFNQTAVSKIPNSNSI